MRIGRRKRKRKWTEMWAEENEQMFSYKDKRDLEKAVLKFTRKK